MKILVTAGATRERIDDIRFISNMSTGRTGAILAEFLNENAEVIYLHGVQAAKPKISCKMIVYDSFKDLNEKMFQILQMNDIDFIIHAAAVSDYSVSQIRADKPYQTNKLDSNLNLEISLRPNFKIIERLKSYARGRTPCVIGFKLTNTASLEDREKAILKLSESPNVDYVVHNDLSEISENGIHKFRIYKKNEQQAECDSASELALFLDRLMNKTTTQKQHDLRRVEV